MVGTTTAAKTAHRQRADHVLDAVGDAEHHPVALLDPQAAQGVGELVHPLVESAVGDRSVAGVVGHAVGLLARPDSGRGTTR